MWLPLHKSLFFMRSTKRHIDDNDDDDPYSIFLKKPKTQKIDNELIITKDGLEIGHSSMQGLRRHMEDQYIMDEFFDKHTLVAVMDGHAGEGCAQFASVKLVELLEATETWNEYCNAKDKTSENSIDLLSRALVQAYIDLDVAFLESDFMDGSGCTCVCAIITPTHIVCANVGDSRCVIGTDGYTISMTDDHKPTNPEEQHRIMKAGGFVKFGRVNGELAMSRAIGDYQYKENSQLQLTEQLVICIPDISVHKRSDSDELIVLACDGVWDVMSNSEAISYLSGVVMTKKAIENYVDEDNLDSMTDEELTSQDLAEALIDLALESGSTDNLSAIIVKLK